MDSEDKDKYFNSECTRRGFVKGLSAGFAGFSLFSHSPLLPGNEGMANKMVYRRLGRTGFQTSEIGLGGHYDGPNWTEKNSGDQSVRDEVFLECIKGGVNFLDSNNERERIVLGKSFQLKPEIRDQVIMVADINDKDATAQEIYDFIIESMEEQLRNLQIPYVDIMRFTQVIRRTPPERCEAAIRAFQKVKKEGKAKYLAFAQHNPDLLLDMVNRYDEIDVIYVPYNYFASKADEELFGAAHKKDLGIVVIKPFNKGTIFDPRLADLIRGGGSRSVMERADRERGARTPEDLTRETNLTLAQAMLRFILSNPEISTVIPGMESVEEVRQNLRMAGTGPRYGRAERQLLDGYAAHVDTALPENYHWLKSWKRA